MKAKIAKLEGDNRRTTKLHESLGKHVQILEVALKREREKVKSDAPVESVGTESTEETRDKDKLKADLKREPEQHCLLQLHKLIAR